MTRKALGRGLSALIPAAPVTPAATAVAAASDGTPIKIAVDKIRANHLQPRRHFDPEALGELAASIKQHGLAQPIVVSYDPLSRSYELIAGERRWRATQLAGLQEIEVVVRQPKDDKQRLALTLIENLQRADLNPIEVALGYLRLMKEFGINQTALGEEVGKSKSGISNTLRLLELPEEIQKALQFGQLSEGHGRALLMVTDPNLRHAVFKKVLEGKLSVRETESLAKQVEAGEPPAEEAPVKKAAPPKPADLRALEETLQTSLGTKVVIRANKNPAKGSIQIHYFSFDDFDKIIKVLKK
ncbi:MAG TPA: ParB/RepB/Spo0J family partition protein [Elusimicrobiota bacterium]|nr:ParB/RepB/Spo0J family partition protein [Elusimicrobiota bacterium]